MKRLIFGLFFLLFLSYSYAQQDTDSILFDPVNETLSDVRFFNVDDPLTITLKYDISSFIKTKAKGEYFPAELRIYVADSDSIVKNIRLKARGNFRRGHCYFPPIYLNFKTDPIDKTELEGIKKIKMVTHCSSNKTYQSYIMREYLIYKIYSILTDNSFRVRLLDINYLDTGKKGHNHKQKGFLIEPMELVTKRLRAVEVRQEAVFGKHLLPEESTLVALFQYFIGNTDWRFKGGHNMKYIKSLDVLTTKLIPLPYDFDHAGFVNASYAMPQEWSSADKITDRDFLGYCQEKDGVYREAIDLFIAKKDEILNIIKTFEYLDTKDKKHILSFVNEFYVQAEKPQSLIWTLKNECRDIDF